VKGRTEHARDIQTSDCALRHVAVTIAIQVYDSRCPSSQCGCAEGVWKSDTAFRNLGQTPEYWQNCDDRVGATSSVWVPPTS